MAVIRIEKSADYTCMSNYHLRDRRLSLRAIGLLSKMLSLPPEWNYSVAGLTSICKEGRDAIKAALGELEAAGYMTRERTHDGGGKFSGIEYVIREAPPVADASADAPLTDFPSVVAPSAAFPPVVKPPVVNPQQLNTESNKLLNLNNKTPCSPPEGDGAGAKKRKREPKAAPDWEPERFKGFWQAYPRGENKQAAIAAWDKLHADAGLLNRMARALKKQLASEEWRRGIGIPYAATWLNGRRWEDEDKRPGQLPEPTGMDEGEAAWM